MCIRDSMSMWACTQGHVHMGAKPVWRGTVKPVSPELKPVSQAMLKPVSLEPKPVWHVLSRTTLGVYACGHVCMGMCAWSHGPGPMAQGPWPRAHGPRPRARGPWPGARGTGPAPGARGPGPAGPGPISSSSVKKTYCARILIEGARFPPFGFVIAEISSSSNEYVSFCQNRLVPGF